MSTNPTNEVEKSNDRVHAVIVGLALLILPPILNYKEVHVPSWLILAYVLGIRWWAIKWVHDLYVGANRNGKMAYWVILSPSIMLIIAGSLKKKEAPGELSDNTHSFTEQKQN